VLPAASELPAVRSLPDPFAFASGARVQDLEDWRERRRELARLAQHYQYGTLPPPPESVTAALHGKTLTISVAANGRRVSFDAGVSLPDGEGPFPAFVFLVGRAPPLEAFTRRGYAALSLDTKQIAGDESPSRGAFYTLYPDSDAGVLLAWAWAVHRVVDVARSVPELDAARIAVNGFSRWGKASLLASALDERIALTVPSSSGLSGAGPYRYFYEDPADPSTRNEKISNIVGYAPQWFTPRFSAFLPHVERLPHDQHSIMALVAPRPLLITTGTRDHWCNPRGSALALRAAQKVYAWLGATERLGSSWDDAAHECSESHVRDMLDFADVHLAGAAASRSFLTLPNEFPDDPAAHPWSAPPFGHLGNSRRAGVTEP
jgi:hypothetical protein